MSRRKARSGTRKQNGGFLGFLLEKLNKINPANWFRRNPENSDPPLGTAAAANGAAPADPADPTLDPPQAGGARKTRHRRRHHRK
jgi:hypothetical protein